MAEISKENIREFIRRGCAVKEELNMTMQEVEIATRSMCTGARVYMAKEAMEEDIKKGVEDELHPATAKEKILKWLPSICGTLAIILSAISILATVWK